MRGEALNENELVFEHPVELCGENLKLKYRVRRPVSSNGTSSGGKSGKPVHGPVPVGIRKHHLGKGKTHFA